MGNQKLHSLTDLLKRDLWRLWCGFMPLVTLVPIFIDNRVCSKLGISPGQPCPGNDLRLWVSSILTHQYITLQMVVVNPWFGKKSGGMVAHGSPHIPMKSMALTWSNPRCTWTSPRNYILPKRGSKPHCPPGIFIKVLTEMPPCPKMSWIEGVRPRIVRCYMFDKLATTLSNPIRLT